MFGNRIHGYRNSKRMEVNGMVKQLCKEQEVGYVDLWDSFVGKEEMYARDGLHLSGKGAAVFAEGLSGAVASGLGKVSYLNQLGRGVCQRRPNPYKRVVDAREYRVVHPKKKFNVCA